MQAPSDRPYHHGDLRRAIVDTALDLLQEENNWQFTLREVARRAGVSHAAPYKHFPDKSALLSELATIGFERLRGALLAAGTKGGTTLLEEVSAVSRAYIAFGAANPALYRLMFSAEEGRVVGVHLDAPAMAVFQVVVDLLQRGQVEGRVRQQPLDGQAAACWGMVHGMTMLAIDGLLVPEKVGPSPLDAALIVLVGGLAIPGN
ncbi:TetR/AcrR family transcriptional regulator [Xanthomonas sp. NCPPB 3582]|uniref:TetR/AcrR family transcriptional regulator n=1 Tax=Xanthomonas sp. NCPPB 3582 TaxID=487557 RepID=UPI0035587494